MQLLIPTGETWIARRDGDASCRKLFDRHYSRRHRADGRKSKLFVGPGGKIVLATADRKALFVWRRFVEIGQGKPRGVYCSVFRNEGPLLSSYLILLAEVWAWQRWPGERLYTHVDPAKVRSRNPGCCFIKAGWRVCGKTKRGLIELEKRPEWKAKAENSRNEGKEA